MKTETIFGTFEQLLEGTNPELSAIARQLRNLIYELDPNTVEVVRLGDKAATYGIGPAKMKEGYLYIMPQKAWINLGFYHGASLDNSAGLLEGTGKSLRHIKVKNIEIAMHPELKSLVAKAISFKILSSNTK